LRFRIRQFAVLIALFFASLAKAQVPTPNADIVKMIQAGLPESSIVNKIREGAGHWDTSVDSLIALKHAGATDAELSALTAAAAPPPSAAASAPQPPSVVEVLGGYLSNHGGDYTLFEPGSSPNDYLSNMLFHIVVIDGHPALRLSVRGDYLRKLYGHCYSTWGDLIFEHDKLTYYPYGRINWAFALGKWKSETMAPDPSLKPITLPMASVNPKIWDPKKTAVPDVHLTQHGEYTDDEFPYSFGWGEAFEVNHTMPSEEFLQALFANFDGTMAQLLHAAALTDPDHQLGPESHFTPPTPAEIPAILVVLNRDLARWRTAVLEERKNQQQASGGSSFLSLMNAMQGITNMAQAQNQANIAAANHDMAGQMQAALNAGRAETQTLNALSNPSAPPIQPAAPSDPNAIQNATNQQLANIQARQAQLQPPQQRPLQTASAKAVASFPVNPPAKPLPSSGTAPPPACVDLGPGNCMPIAQYQQMQAQKKQGVVLNTLCPASGFVPGVMTHPSPDVALGVQCKPGSVIYINGVPQFDTTNGSTTGTGGGLGTGAGNGGSENGVSSANPTDGPSEVGCIQLSSDPTNTYPVFHNTCSFQIKYFWTPFHPAAGEFAEQNGILQPGETQTGAESAVGGYRVYACQTNYIVAGPDGSPITQVVSGFRCMKP